VKGMGKGVGVNGQVSTFLKYLFRFWKQGMDKGRGEMEVKLYYQRESLRREC
jgi:hypothetical protein